MLRRRFVAGAASALTLLLTPQLAPAGPIDWDYSAELTAGSGGGWVSFGFEDPTLSHPAVARAAFGPAAGEGGGAAYLLLANVARAERGTRTDSGTVRVGAFGPADLHRYPTDDPWALARPGVFFLRFDLTDSPRV